MFNLYGSHGVYALGHGRSAACQLARTSRATLRFNEKVSLALAYKHGVTLLQYAIYCHRHLQELERSMKSIEGEQSQLDKTLDQLDDQVM